MSYSPIVYYGFLYYLLHAHFLVKSYLERTKISISENYRLKEIGGLALPNFELCYWLFQNASYMGLGLFGLFDPPGSSISQTAIVSEYRLTAQ